MTASDLRRSWSEGRAVYGVAVRSGTTLACEMLAATSLDFAWIDLQHGHNSSARLLPQLQALNGSSITPLVRVEANDPVSIGHALDAGAEGVIVPSVESSLDARRAVAACRFPPEGARSYADFRAQYLPGGAMRPVLCLVMIESRRGVADIDEIVATPGVDGVFIGPADLALSMGLEPKPSIQPGAHSDAIAAVQASCDAAGVVTAITGNPEPMRQLGFRMISLGADLGFLEHGLADALSKLTAEP